MKSKKNRASSVVKSSKGRKSKASQSSPPLNQQLLDELNDLRTVFHFAPILIWFKDDNNVILQANHLAAASANVTPEEMRGRHTKEFYPDEADKYLADDLEVIRSGKPKLGIIEKLESTQGTLWVQTDKIPWKDSSGNIKGVVVLVRDITQRMHIQEELQKAHDELEVRVEQRTQELSQIHAQLRQSQKMEAIGTLAGGIAHDFNNMLAGIIGNAELIKYHATPGSETYESAGIIENAAWRSARLTQQLLGFARRGKHQNVSIDLQTLVVDMVRMLKRTMDKGIEIVEDFQAKIPWIQGDPEQIQQVLLNLMVNARDAMPKGGKIYIRLRDVELTQPDQPLTQNFKSGAYIELIVEDTGSGIAPDHLDRIFEPFFTTKEIGKGTGMGLALVYGILTNHGGNIRVKSSVGHGTIFQILLPATMQSDETTRSKPVAMPIKGEGTILVIDDEPLVLKTIAKLLQQIGYKTVVFENSHDALVYYQNNFPLIDLVLIDMMMPGMNGKDCFQALKKINPRLKAILSTGFAINTSAHNVHSLGIQGFLTKPYQIQEISEVISSVLKRE